MSVFDIGSPAAVFAAVAAGAAMKYVAGIMLKSPKRQYRLVGTVDELWIFPVKSLRGISIKEAEVERLGLKCGQIGDRQWVVTNSERMFLCQRRYPKMALVRQIICEDEIELQAPGMDPIRFPATVELNSSSVGKVNVKGDIVDAVDLGDEIGSWLSKYLNLEGARLYFSHPSLEKRDCSKGSKIKTKTWETGAKEGDTCGFPDFCSYMIISKASIDDLNAKLEKPLPVSNFRANIVIKDCEAFEEDFWSNIRIGNAYLRVLDPCTRCVMTTVDQSTGIKDKDDEPLTTLRKYRVKQPYNKPLLGMNCVYDKCGTIRVGDRVYALQA